MGRKDEVFSKFVKFKAIVYMETGNKVNSLKKNNRGEFVSHALKNFYAKEGI